MFTLKVENSNGSLLVLTQNESKYQVLSVTGLNPPPAQINTITVAGMDGALFNSAKLNTRNIVITLRLNGDVETNRQTLYGFFNTKELVTIFYTNTNRDVFIEGYVETVEVDLFTRSEIMQVSILCPQPYFKSAEAIVEDISVSLAAFSFPFSINIGEPVAFSSLAIGKTVTVTNASDQSVGAVFTITFDASVFDIRVFNVTTNEIFAIYYAFETGDIATVNTARGQKSITLVRGGVETNLFPYLEQGSQLFSLVPGENELSYSADNGSNNRNVSVLVMYHNEYRGV